MKNNLIGALKFTGVLLPVIVVPVFAFAASPIMCAMIHASSLQSIIDSSMLGTLIFSVGTVGLIVAGSLYCLVDTNNFKHFATSILMAGAGISTVSICAFMMSTINDIKYNELYINAFTQFIQQDTCRTLALQAMEPGLILGIIVGSLAIVGAATYAIGVEQIHALFNKQEVTS
jgi:hypothetical protein